MTDAVPTPPPATANRRNFYRVLHVQPEAPVEVIQASYRTLMTRLKVHPDLGGSHEQAALVNEAWAVLGDPVRRAAYDAQLRRRGEWPPARPNDDRAAVARACGAAAEASGLKPFRPKRESAPSARAGGGAPQAPRAAAQARKPGAAGGTGAPRGPGPSSPGANRQASTPEPHPWAEGRRCAMCGQPAPAPSTSARDCVHCGAPLQALPVPGKAEQELFGRRKATRRAKAQPATAYLGPDAKGLPVRWRDVSLTGASFWAPRPLAVGQRVRLVDDRLDLVAEVVACRPRGDWFAVHARLLAGRLQQGTGAFVSATA